MSWPVIWTLCGLSVAGEVTPEDLTPTPVVAPTTVTMTTSITSTSTTLTTTVTTTEWYCLVPFTTNKSQRLQCTDYSYCDGWNCCADKGKKRIRCPGPEPLMCARDNHCAQGRDRCCLLDCTDYGGEATCLKDDCQELVDLRTFSLRDRMQNSWIPGWTDASVWRVQDFFNLSCTPPKSYRHNWE